MHRLFLTLSCLALLLGAATLASCDKTPMNGDLDGFINAFLSMRAES